MDNLEVTTSEGGEETIRRSCSAALPAGGGEAMISCALPYSSRKEPMYPRVLIRPLEMPKLRIPRRTIFPSLPGSG